MAEERKTRGFVRPAEPPRIVPIPPKGDFDARFEEQAQGQITSRTGDPPRSPRLLDRVRQEIRTRHYSRRTETAYVAWIKRFIFFHDKRYPNEMGEAEISGFVCHLATHRKVSASTQGQALAALLFLYKNVLRRELNFDGDHPGQASCSATSNSYEERGRRDSPAPSGNVLVDGITHVWIRPARSGVLSIAGQGHRF